MRDRYLQQVHTVSLSTEHGLWSVEVHMNGVLLIMVYADVGFKIEPLQYDISSF